MRVRIGFLLALAFFGTSCGGAATRSSVASSPTPIPKAPLTVQSQQTITDTDTLDLAGSTVPEATVQLLDASGNPVSTVNADQSGSFTFHVTGIPVGTNTYTVKVIAHRYSTQASLIAITRNISPETYKASAASVSYGQLSKDPESFKGRVVTFDGQIFQYDSATTTSNFLVSVTNSGYGFWTDNVWADVSPAITSHVCKGTVIRFWGDVVGPYTYTTTLNGHITLPEIRIQYLDVLSNGC
jgi:hypothetical protein